MQLILYNNVCKLVQNKYNNRDEINNFLTTYATCENIVKNKTFAGSSKAKGIVDFNTTYEKVSVPLYLISADEENNEVYVFPRGLFDMLADEVKNTFNIIDKRTNNFNIDIGLTPDDKNYVAKILQPESGFDLREDQVIAIIKTLKVKRGLNQYPTGCLKGNTLIKLADTGETVTIEEMYFNRKNYLNRKVFSLSETLKVVEGTIKDIKLTKFVNNYITILLNNGKEICCTHNHPIMSKLGYYINAEDSDTLGFMTVDFDHFQKSLNSYKCKMLIDTHLTEIPIPVYDLEIETYHNFAIQVNDHKGIIVHNSGKTEIMSGIIKILSSYYFDIRILVIEPTDILVNKTAQRFKKYLIDAIPYKDDRGSIEHNVIVSHPMALINDLQKNPNLLECINGVFFDECLHESSIVYARTSSNDNSLINEKSMLVSYTIKEVYENDDINEVLSYNINTCRCEFKKIKRKIRKHTGESYTDKFWKLVVFDPVRQTRFTLYLTDNHKIYLPLECKYVPLVDLHINDTISVIDPYKISIINATVDEFHFYCKESDYKYNLEVEDNHNYFANNILVSNCHHIQSNTWSLLNKCIPNAEYTVGMSALAVYEDHKFCRNLNELSLSEALILGAVGRVLNAVPAKYYFDRGILTLPVVIQFKFNEILLPKNMNDWHKLRKQFIESVPRMLLVCNIANKFLQYGRRSLILVGTKKQAYLVAKLFTSEYHLENNVGIAFGGDEGRIFSKPLYDNVMSRKRKKSDVSKLSTDEYAKCMTTVKNIADKFDNKELNILIATSVLYEGFDCDHLDAVIMAAGSKAELRILQIVGRALRKSKTGKYAYVIDFDDSSNGVLAYHANQRIKTYESIIEVPRDLVLKSFDIDEFDSVFCGLEGIKNNE